MDEVCSRTKFHTTCFDANVWIFHIGLVWWGVSSNIHKFPLISNVCTFELQFEFLNVFSNFSFVSITNIYCGWGRHKTIYYSCITRPCIINKVFNNIDIANLQLLHSWNSLRSCLYFSRNRWIVPTSWNLKRIEWIRGNIITPFPF